jgi:hypothetical protein
VVAGVGFGLMRWLKVDGADVAGFAGIAGCAG